MAESVFPWFGGKTLFLPKILRLLPQHQTYVEVFGGSGALLMAKHPSPVEVYNDLDEGLVNFFRVMRSPENSTRLMKLCEMTPYSRSEYIYARDHWSNEPDEVVKAYLWYLVARWSFSARFGTMIGFDITASANHMAGRVNKWRSSIKKMPKFTERLLKVQVENRDFRDILKTYDRSTTLFYLDPPYVPETRRDGTYVHELTLEDHYELVEILLSLQGMAVLSGYENDVYKPLVENNWDRYEYQTWSWADVRDTNNNNPEKHTREMRTEVIWTNPACKAQHRQLNLFNNAIPAYQGNNEDYDES